MIVLQRLELDTLSQWVSEMTIKKSRSPALCDPFRPNSENSNKDLGALAASVLALEAGNGSASCTTGLPGGGWPSLSHNGGSTAAGSHDRSSGRWQSRAGVTTVWITSTINIPEKDYDIKCKIGSSASSLWSRTKNMACSIQLAVSVAARRQSKFDSPSGKVQTFCAHVARAH